MDLKRNKKGFTLVELIVVLVIIGILLAMVIPNLTGYINKARAKNNEVEARAVYMAVMAYAAEDYIKTTHDTAVTLTEIEDLAPVSGTISVPADGGVVIANGAITAGFTYKSENGKITTVVDKDGGMTTTVTN